MKANLSNVKKQIRLLKLISSIVTALFIATPLMGQACDRETMTQYQNASQEMSALDSSVHNFLSSLNNKKDIELLILAYSVPEYISAFHQRLTALSENQPRLTKELTDFYLCEGLKKSEIETRFGEMIEQHNELLQHLNKHDADFSTEKFTSNMKAGRDQAVTYFGDEETGVLTPLKLTERIFKHIANNYALQATVFDLWELKQAKGSQNFITATGINILKNSPQAQLQKHLDRGLSKDTFLDFTGPKNGEEYPQSIHHFAQELSGYNGSGNLPSVEEIPNRSKLAITIAMSDENEQEFIKLLSQYEAAATLFKTRAKKRYGIKNWQKMHEQFTTENEVFQAWGILKVYKIQKQVEAIEQLLDPKADKDWQAIIEAVNK